MQSRTPIIVALLVGLAAAFATSLYVDQIRQRAQPDMTLVMIAMRDLAPGATLEARDVDKAERDTRSLPKLAIRWDEHNLYLGQQLAMDVKEGDYILQPYFGTQGSATQRPADRVDAKGNQRAVTIPVNAETSLQESIRAGDRIDILLTYRQKPAVPLRGTGSAEPLLVTMPLLDNVYVLFTGKFGSLPGAGYGTITLLVSADEAKLLLWAMNLGKMSILLRNPKDLQILDRTHMSGDDGTLSALSRTPLRIEDLISREQK